VEDITPAQARHALDGTAADITAARALTRDFLTKRTPPIADGLIQDALLAVSELVTNAVRHAAGPFELELTDDGRRLVIAVSDTTATVPTPRAADLSGGGGMGLHVLNGLAGQIETRTHAAGKTVRITLMR
jgi:anti-sigma regulatory factor (Ser/Thr protein kinase)